MTGNNNNGQPVEIEQDFERQLILIDNGDRIDPCTINKILIRNNILLNCKYTSRTDGLKSDFAMINDVLHGILNLNRNILKSEVLPMISWQNMGTALYNEVFNWIYNEGSLLIVKYLPYLSIACKMTFHQCNIQNHRDHGPIFVPVDQNHDISKTIYYLCDSSRQDIIALFITDRTYINHIHNKLLLQTHNNVQDKIRLYNILISEYIKQTKIFQFHQHLPSLSKWQDIYKCYRARIELKPEPPDNELLDYCRCLIKLSKYSDAEETLLGLKTEGNQTSEVWCLLARAQRKSQKYSNEEINRRRYGEYSAAHKSINMALLVNGGNEEAKQEQKIINRLIERKSLEETPVQYSIERRRRNNECSSYNILSIDGGGIRGIMAAVWLRELERITNRSCSSMFRMMAGTSTGAIIAAGLSMPEENSSTEPAYDASKLVELYKTCGKDIFVKKHRHFLSYKNISYSLAPKYSSDGKQELFERYFRQTSLYQCLTDIVIPAVRSSDIYTHLFTKNESSYSTSLVDVLMATTAAPTYFKPHYLNGINYIDGGVQVNNPSLAAYTKAIEYGYNKENIFVLSLGTGDYIEDPVVANNHRDFIYYLRHRHTVIKVLLDSQQHNVDYQMGILMSDTNYYRWQVWFDEMIELDKYEPDIVNKLENMAYEYWEEMEVYDEERLRRLIKHLKNE